MRTEYRLEAKFEEGPGSYEWGQVLGWTTNLEFITSVFNSHVSKVGPNPIYRRAYRIVKREYRFETVAESGMLPAKILEN